MPSDLPEGFKPFGVPDDFAGLNGPLYCKRLPDGEFIYGFRVGERHLNPNGVLHGGMMFTFADQFLGRVVVAETRRICTTVKLNVEFLAPGKGGDWIEGRAETLRVTRDMAYMRAQVSAGHRTLMTAQGIWRLFGEIPARPQPAPTADQSPV